MNATKNGATEMGSASAHAKVAAAATAPANHSTNHPAIGRPKLEIILAGFGGQGILFAGKVIAYAGLLEGREVSWLPSYGPEMRGGTANCSVCLADEPIGSPLISIPDVLIALNRPSLEAFINKVAIGGLVLADKSMADACPLRPDIRFVQIPATQLAEDNDLKGLANVIMVGKLLQLTAFADRDILESAIDRSISAKRQELASANKRALAIGCAHVSTEDCR
ncbi:MAG: 2-oxoacid:acceptor oxidoreductase family protein [Coriobacteriales bacterium]|jgi:2-oxoglutarate ferredoxin oxidoreductase subunit gamma|nr:2-oxoacid:acceptor oxidoreductase family protein [Coriobacteriales bacterium]